MSLLLLLVNLITLISEPKRLNGSVYDYHSILYTLLHVVYLNNVWV